MDPGPILSGAVCEVQGWWPAALPVPAAAVPTGFGVQPWDTHVALLGFYHVFYACCDHGLAKGTKTQPAPVPSRRCCVRHHLPLLVGQMEQN